MMEPIRVEDITVETLDRVAEQWEEDRIISLVRDSVMQLGRDLRHARQYKNELEARSKIRAMKLYYQYDMPKKEIAWLFGVEVREVTKWLKPRSQ
mgnify:CR=1 FL=1